MSLLLFSTQSHDPCWSLSHDCRKQWVSPSVYPIMLQWVLLWFVEVCVRVLIMWMCVLYVSFGSKVRPRTFGCAAIRSAVLFIFKSRLLLYFAGSGVNRVQVVLSVFSVRFFQAKTLCRYGCMYFLTALALVCVDVMLMSSAWAMTWTRALLRQSSENCRQERSLKSSVFMYSQSLLCYKYVLWYLLYTCMWVDL